MHRITLLIIMILLSLPAINGQGPYIPPSKPKLVVGIVVEQLRYDQLEMMLEKFRENGIRRLINEGTYYKGASYQYLSTQSGPGHATISTGAEPSAHGIVADSWYETLRDDLVYCTADPSVYPAGGSFENGLQSPAKLLASTFTDELKRSTGGKSKIFGISLNDHAAILSTGHAGDAAYWFDNTTGTFMSSTYYLKNLPPWVMDFNAMKYSDSYLNRVWEPLLPLKEYSWCQSDTGSYETGFDGVTWFPYDLKKMSSKGLLDSKKNYPLIRETPYGNTLVTDFAIRLIDAEGMGLDDITDNLTIAYSANDNIGHRFGPASVEASDALLRLDIEIERLLNYLNDKVGKKNILVYFTSAHGVAEVPGLLENMRIPAGYFRPNQALTIVKSYLNVTYGQGNWIKAYHDNQLYLNRTLIEDANIQLEDIQKRISRFLVQFSGVASAIPTYSFESGLQGDGFLKKAWNNYYPKRTGDIIITLDPGWIEKGDYSTTHNSPYEYDAHVPLVFYGWTVNRSSVTRNVNMTDLAPTLSVLLRIPRPNACSGEPLQELFR